MGAFAPGSGQKPDRRNRLWRAIAHRSAAQKALVAVGLPATCLVGATLLAQAKTPAVSKPATKHSPISEERSSVRNPVIGQYCAGCHSGSDPAAGFDITRLDTAHPERNLRQWESTILQIRAGLMPPAGASRPKAGVLDNFASSIEPKIDRFELAHPDPGAPALHRLNRTEYANSIRDLLNVDVDVKSLLPPDDMSHGFDNMAEVLNVSPTLLSGYVRAAGKISRVALGDPKTLPGEEVYHLPSAFSQTQHVDGTAFGTRGGTVIRHNFPADGDYVLTSSLYFTTNALLFGSTQNGEKLEVAVNGKEVALFPVNPRMKIDEVLRTKPIRVLAGPQTITVAFVQKASGPVEDFVQPFDHSLGDLFLGRTQGLTGLPHLRDVSIKGPYNVTGVSETPSRDRILVRRPHSAADEPACAREILTTLARRAYRRQINESDASDLMRIYRLGRQHETFDDGIRLGVQFIIANPQFVFRFERPPQSVRPGTNYPVSDVELASRLSYFLWSSAPDDRLLDLAAHRKLRDPQVLEGEVRRMLADPRSEALASNFAGQWLHLRNLKDIQPDLFSYPNANANLLDSMRRETELFFWSIVREDRSVDALINADYTYVNEGLAKLYGIPDVEGTRLRRVQLADPNRRGLLGQASVLTVTSFANRTSPVLRGKWVLDNLLGAPPPKQPANIPPLKEIADGTPPSTVRARLEQHRANPACASCHTMMDPIGFSLENFNAIGGWRIRDNGFRIDSRGTLVDGTPVASPQNLRKWLDDHPDAFRRNFTQKLLTYALGRGSEYYDMPAVRAIDSNARRNGDRFSSYVIGIVKSIPFQMRRAGPADAPRSQSLARR